MVSVEDIEGFAASPHHKILAAIIQGETGMSSAGFPTISEISFHLWMTNVPHLFTQGSALLDWLQTIEEGIARTTPPSSQAVESWLRAIKVLETVIQTAAVTAPTDLWLMKHILTSHHRAGILKLLQSRKVVCLQDLASSQGLSIQQLRYDFHFLKSRAVVTDADGDDGCALTSHPQIQNLIDAFEPLDPAAPVNWLPLLNQCFAGQTISREDRQQLTDFLTMPEELKPAPNWIPGRLEMELGYRLVPLLLAWRNSPYHQASPECVIPEKVVLSHLMNACLMQAGLVHEGSKPTALGRRVLERGPGPFGIIHAYHEYMKHHSALLQGQRGQTWVARGENVAASQDANRKTFLMINDSIDRFMARHNFQMKVFIEHAVGQGEATRQRYARSGADTIQYFGADLEDAAIDRAVEAQKRGELPPNMRFVRKADIGDPGYLIKPLEAWGVSVQGAIMVVGNGFHEIRSQTNEKMIAVFKGYNEAGILLIFTEESALSDDDLLHTGWNTYHAGFRFVHEISGQGLRPAYEYDKETDRLSWRACLERAGYWVHPSYTTQTRTIYPVPRANGYNPAISVNYFCIPTWLAGRVREN
ncbi:hypothetical protein [Oligoflexus tunisiensis]|uniref:hypothetical protein n=1 Tax=Oligoflexus tunisiensis TaxID=708132 RepID=UPI00114CB5FB|nr:hypothetical protein [Oligoflexus tunisiensis]